MESPNTSLQAIELNPSCLGQVYSNRPSTGPGYEHTKPGCILTMLRIPSIVCPLKNVDAKSGKIVQKIPHNWHKWAAGKHLRTHLKDHTRYNQCLKIYGRPMRVLLPVSKAQLAGCLKVWLSGLLEWNAGIQ